MRAWASGLGLAITLLCATSHAHGQKATEQYIPIGQSPGVSKKYTSIGPIASVNTRDMTVAIDDPAGSKTVKVTAKTRIWLDRSKIKKPNLKGAFSDLQQGRLVEVKYLDSNPQVAEWVKVEVGQP